MENEQSIRNQRISLLVLTIDRTEELQIFKSKIKNAHYKYRDQGIWFRLE